MKKWMILLTVFILSGCSTNQIVDHKISCVKKETVGEITTFDTVNIELINSKIVSINLNIETELSGEKLKYKKVFIKSLEEKYQQLKEDHDIDTTIEETDKGTIVNSTMTLEQYQELQENDTLYDNDDIVLSFKEEGYTCK